MKLAICQVSDSGPAESLIVMLRAAGYEPRFPNIQLRRVLSSLGCDTVVDPESLIEKMGYEPIREYKSCTLEDMLDADLYVDVKAHRNWPKLMSAWPNLRGKVLWYRINGGEPIDTEHGGNELEPGCPILTPNQWYKGRGDAYVIWPPFYGWPEYQQPRFTPTILHKYDPAICLIHNLEGWGHGPIAPLIRQLGVKCYGRSSPDGLINHSEVPNKLQRAIVMVHLKTNDCPGYALYEALAASCPVIINRHLITRMKMQELFIEGETCLCYGYCDHSQETKNEWIKSAREIEEHLGNLRNYKLNQSIGERGKAMLQSLMWKPDNGCKLSIRDFFKRNFIG